MKSWHRLAQWALVMAWAAMPWAAAQAARQALVIGNAAYIDSPLKNPVNDARAMEAKLKALGFAVMKVENVKQAQIGRMLREFAGRLQPGDEVVVFYAGHGLQVKGINYLPAVDARIESEDDVPFNSLNLGQLLDKLEEAKVGVKLVFLDACRNNPFSRGFRSSGSRGLARVMDAPSGTLMHFATRPGSVAADGTGDNGLYTTELLKFIDKPGLPVELMLKEVSASVERVSRSAQEPWMEGSIKGNFVFVPLVAPATPSPVAQPSPEPLRPSPMPPTSGGLSLEDLKKEQATRDEWAKWQARMKADFEAATRFGGSADLQAKAWERFLASWAQDNPLSTEDEGLRSQAQQKLTTARDQAQAAQIQAAAAVAVVAASSATAVQALPGAAQAASAPAQGGRLKPAEAPTASPTVATSARECAYMHTLSFGGAERDCVTQYPALMNLPGQAKDWVPSHGIYSLALSDGPGQCVGHAGVASSNSSTYHVYQNSRDQAAMRQCQQSVKSALGEAGSQACSCSIVIQNGAAQVGRDELLRRLGVML